MCFVSDVIVFLILSSTPLYCADKPVSNSYKQLNTNCQDGADLHCLARKQNTPQMQLRLSRIDPVEVGHIQEVELIKGQTHYVITLSVRPPVFEISDFFTEDECEFVVEMAKLKGMKDSPLAKDSKELARKTTEETFKQWDANEDGFINVDEIVYLPGKSDLYFTEKDALEMFNALNMDANGDGKIDLSEFQKTTVFKITDYFEKLRRQRPRMRSRNYRQAWLWHDEDELLKYEDVMIDYHERISSLTGLPTKVIEQSEPLQVVKYEEHGHYHCHHDSEVINTNLSCCTHGDTTCRLCRYLTIMVYLNDVEEEGYSAFPLANNQTFSWEVWARDSHKKCNLAKNCGLSNLRIKPRKGKAIFWYNHLLHMRTGWLSALDPLSYHGECGVKKGEKWLANIWVNVVGDGQKEFKAWKTGVNWLAKNKPDNEIVDSLLNTEITEELSEIGFIENRYTKDKHVTIGEERNEYGENKVAESVSKDKDVKRKEIQEGNNPAPLPLTKEQVTQDQTQSPASGPLPPPNVEGNRIVAAILMLLEELDRVEMEIVARLLHERMKLVCVPLMINPMGGIR